MATGFVLTEVSEGTARFSFSMFHLPLPHPAPLPHLVLAFVCVVSAWTDLRSQEIWDLVTVPGLVLGLLLGAAVGGWRGLATAGGGAALGLVTFGLLWLAGVVESGDVLLTAALGALVGFPAIMTLMMIAALLGLPVALVWAAARGELRRTLANLWRLVVGRWRGGESQQVELTPFPFGVAISLAGLYVTACAYVPQLALWRL